MLDVNDDEWGREIDAINERETRFDLKLMSNGLNTLVIELAEQLSGIIELSRC